MPPAPSTSMRGRAELRLSLRGRSGVRRRGIARGATVRLRRDTGALFARDHCARRSWRLTAGLRRLTAGLQDFASGRHDLAAERDDLGAGRHDLALGRNDFPARRGALAARRDTSSGRRDDLSARRDDLSARRDDLSARRAASALRARERSSDSCHGSIRPRSRTGSTNPPVLGQFGKPAELADGLALCATPNYNGDSPRRPIGRLGSPARRPLVAPRFGSLCSARTYQFRQRNSRTAPPLPACTHNGHFSGNPAANTFRSKQTPRRAAVRCCLHAGSRSTVTPSEPRDGL